jgi:hypothetical protein
MSEQLTDSLMQTTSFIIDLVCKYIHITEVFKSIGGTNNELRKKIKKSIKVMERKNNFNIRLIKVYIYIIPKLDNDIFDKNVKIARKIVLETINCEKVKKKQKIEINNLSKKLELLIKDCKYNKFK